MKVEQKHCVALAGICEHAFPGHRLLIAVQLNSMIVIVVCRLAKNLQI